MLHPTTSVGLQPQCGVGWIVAHLEHPTFNNPGLTRDVVGSSLSYKHKLASLVTGVMNWLALGSLLATIRDWDLDPLEQSAHGEVPVLILFESIQEIVCKHTMLVADPGIHNRFIPAADYSLPSLKFGDLVKVSFVLMLGKRCGSFPKHCPGKTSITHYQCRSASDRSKKDLQVSVR